MSDDYSPW